MILATLVACSGRGESPPTPKPAEGPTFTVFYLTELRGQTEPCGCTTDPKGDLSRTTELIRAAKASGPVIVLDGGGTLYPKPPLAELPADAPEGPSQNALTAAFIEQLYRTTLAIDAWGIGPNDLTAGARGMLGVRTAANLAPGAPVQAAPSVVKQLGKLRVGVVFIAEPARVPQLPWQDPVTRGAAEVEALRAGGAQHVLVMVQSVSRASGKQLARQLIAAAPGAIDFVLLAPGRETPEPTDAAAMPDIVDGVPVATPANRGQGVVRLQWFLQAPSGPATVVPGAVSWAAQSGLQSTHLAELEADLARFEKDPTADPSFVARIRADRDALAAQLRTPPARPAGNHIVFDHVLITKDLACDTTTQSDKLALHTAVGKTNLALAASQPVAPIAPGQATYVGHTTCAGCHPAADQHWRQTRHARAFDSLVSSHRPYDAECFGCHVTGYDRPGGARIGGPPTLTHVQCEVCHGPGSAHVAATTPAAKKASIRRVPDEFLCASQCHTSDHSDTFDRTAYLRDVLGPGHGADAWRALGDGPTGKQLRAAGLAKAAQMLGPGCQK